MTRRVTKNPYCHEFDLNAYYLKEMHNEEFFLFRCLEIAPDDAFKDHVKKRLVSVQTIKAGEIYKLARA